MAQQNTILWIVGIVLLVVLMFQLPLKNFPFAIVQKTVCLDDKILYYDFNSGPVVGKIGNAIEFNGNNSINIPVDNNANATIMWVKNYSAGDSSYFFLARINGIDYVNTIQSSSRQILPLGPEFGLGFNGSVDELATFTDLNLETLKDIYNNDSGIEVCYTITEEVNVTCSDYALSQIVDNQTASLEVVGELYPACSFTWKSSQYEIKNNQCQKSFFYESSCLESDNCYSTNQECTEDLGYECYVLQNNICFKKTDYNTCIIEDNYDTLTSCQENMIITTNAIVSEPSIKDKLNAEIFDVGGFSVTLLHLIISLIIIVSLLYITEKK